METLTLFLLTFLLVIFAIATKNNNQPKEADQDENDNEEYNVDDLMETLNFLLEHQIITPTQYNQIIVKASQYL